MKFGLHSMGRVPEPQFAVPYTGLPTFPLLTGAMSLPDPIAVMVRAVGSIQPAMVWSHTCQMPGGSEVLLPPVCEPVEIFTGVKYHGGVMLFDDSCDVGIKSKLTNFPESIQA